MLSSFYYYSLARLDHLHAGAYQLKIISTAISSLTRKALLYYWSLLFLHQQPAAVESGYSVTHHGQVVIVY